MKNIIKALVIICSLTSWVNTQAQDIHHRIISAIDIPAKYIDASDSVVISAAFLKNINDTLKFRLNAGFIVRSTNPEYKIKEMKDVSDDGHAEIKSKTWRVTFPSSAKNGFTLPLQYSGKVEGEIKTAAVDYARGFSETSGIISDSGIYMDNSTIWFPVFDEPLFTFSLTTTIDSAWGVVTQGKRTINKVAGGKKVIGYESPEPQDQIYFVAGKWTEYDRQAGDVLVQAVLRTPDTALAHRYLDVTADYLELYRNLIGPYPYSKFTLVENFWETGYGMPSFTLLGSQVIRFPFILTSSYPHELLHNYWGNSVYVDYKKGNWCEGITAYMADHLIKEQQGQGAEYRRVTLQKYTDFVNQGNDFPVIKFTSRNNPAQEAVGYGKVLMIFEMLRTEYGDEAFIKAWAKFYKDNKFRMASFDDIRASFEAVTTKDLKPFFDQWLLRPGAPSLKLSGVTVNSNSGKYQLAFTLQQTQKEEPFTLKVPIAVYLENDNNVDVQLVSLSKKEENYTLTFDKRPLKMDVDPGFNVFRRLDKDEVPYTLSQILGDTDAVIILPKNSPSINEYTELANHWKKVQMAQGNKLEILMDADLKELPSKASWIIGFDNKFAAGLEGFSKYKAYLTPEILGQTDTLGKTGALVYVFPNPKNKLLTNAFLGSNRPAMITALKRKVTHYSKYSYLGFANDAGDNKLKGEFPALASPLSYYIKYDDKLIQSTAKLKPRKALAN